MFTGIVETTGEILKAEPTANGARMWVRAGNLGDAAIGASVSLNGVCLTVAERDGDVCTFDLSAETLARSTLGTKAVGERVNVERPLKVGDELGGHIVQGHVDGIARIESVTDDERGRRIRFRTDDALARYIVEKGSVTLDGVSLTVTNLAGSGFEVALVPHTLAITTFGDAAGGQAVNVEVDVLAKYVERLVRPFAVPDEDPESGYL